MEPIAARCDFHDGTVADLTDGGVFDGATALLVSQFLVDPDARRGFFRAIADRVRPGAPLMVADLAMSAPPDGPLELWRRAWIHADIPPEQAARMSEAFGRQVAVLSPEEVATIIAAGGFETPLCCFQTLLIHGWLARRSP